MLDNFEALEMRALFVPIIIDEPEGFMGGGFALGMSAEKNENQEMQIMSDDDEDGDEWDVTNPYKVKKRMKSRMIIYYRMREWKQEW